jgi:hypothetical protein
MKRPLITCLFLLCIVASCNDAQKQKNLKIKESDLNAREQDLLLREKTVEMKEQELNEKQKKADSLKSKDSLSSAKDSIQLNQNLIGTWSVKMTCTETSCTVSAVGDTKTEHWNLSYQGTRLVAKVIDKNKLSRIYSGPFNQNSVIMTEYRDSSNAATDSRMTVRLNILNDKNMEGKREIIMEDDCRIIYTLQMNKQ